MKFIYLTILSLLVINNSNCFGQYVPKNPISLRDTNNKKDPYGIRQDVSPDVEIIPPVVKDENKLDVYHGLKWEDTLRLTFNEIKIVELRESTPPSRPGYHDQKYYGATSSPGTIRYTKGISFAHSDIGTSINNQKVEWFIKRCDSAYSIWKSGKTMKLVGIGIVYGSPIISLPIAGVNNLNTGVYLGSIVGFIVTGLIIHFKGENKMYKSVPVYNEWLQNEKYKGVEISPFGQ